MNIIEMYLITIWSYVELLSYPVSFLLLTALLAGGIYGVIEFNHWRNK